MPLSTPAHPLRYGNLRYCVANNFWEYLGTDCTRYALYKAEPVAFIGRNRVKRLYWDALFLCEADCRGRPLPFFGLCGRYRRSELLALCQRHSWQRQKR